MLTFKDSDDLRDISYSDSDFARCPDDMKIHFWLCVLLANGSISWESAKETLTVSSTMQIKLVAYYEATIK